MTTPRNLAVAALFLTAAASAQLIRPDGATATSEFSSSYLVLNAINGTGLPTNFSPTDAHATYSTNNHWTTRFGQTIGHSATFTFNAPQSIGGFYMWAHRSNGVASNPYYAVTRFDLVFRDSGGTTLATLPDLVGIPDIASAQTLPFPIVSNVSSIQFIVRATNNNNASPYTGLAEVAFSPCIAASQATLDSVAICPSQSATFNATAFGSGPFTYTWQWQPEGPPNAWIDLVEGVNTDAFGTPLLSASGVNTASLTATPLNSPTESTPALRYLVSNSCGSAESPAANIIICIGDADCDGDDDSDDIVAFFAAWDNGDEAADADGDGDTDSDDVILFFSTWDAGC